MQCLSTEGNQNRRFSGKKQEDAVSLEYQTKMVGVGSVDAKPKSLSLILLTLQVILFCSWNFKRNREGEGERLYSAVYILSIFCAT